MPSVFLEHQAANVGKGAVDSLKAGSDVTPIAVCTAPHTVLYLGLALRTFGTKVSV